MEDHAKLNSAVLAVQLVVFLGVVSMTHDWQYAAVITMLLTFVFAFLAMPEVPQAMAMLGSSGFGILLFIFWMRDKAYYPYPLTMLVLTLAFAAWSAREAMRGVPAYETRTERIACFAGLWIYSLPLVGVVTHFFSHIEAKAQRVMDQRAEKIQNLP